MPTETYIPPGAYRLDRDVQNPRPDHRRTRDWRKMPIWYAGVRFVVREQSRMGAHSLAEACAGLEPHVVAKLQAEDRYTVVELEGPRGSTNHRVGPRHADQYAALAAALVPTEESSSQFMARIGCASEFVEWLIENNAIPRLDLEKWWHRYQYGSADNVNVEPSAVITPSVHDEVPASIPALFSID